MNTDPIREAKKRIDKSVKNYLSQIFKTFRSLMNTDPIRETKKRIDKSVKKLLIKMIFEDGIHIKNAATALNIGYECARQIVSRHRSFSLHSSTPGRLGAPRKLDDETLAQIERISEENSSYTLGDIKILLLARYNKTLSLSSVDNAFRTLMITLKKASIVLDRVNSPETLDLRAANASYFNRFSPEDKARCIFIDESGFNNHLRRTQARARRGARASITVPTIRGAMKTLIVASSCAGILHHKLILDGTCNGEKFKQFIE
ncbi:hypothetical protein ENBRE01_3261, partial [Enteropsectra breve]